ncbi:hypothetical protein F511_22507 [Dorcoceras hygrometricum]|uniref:Uncharacterized protein n=1 Tax=Dorcoceras hygrometricum TaxID=472368 RepID=A0A2Z7CMP4_9LAMI|nr:hypothetical protein F511_22507 [Dorcoceras hygrometricum]
MLRPAIVARERQHASTMARSSGEERRKCAQHLARGGDQRSPKAAHGGALPALVSRNDFARIVSFARNRSTTHRPSSHVCVAQPLARSGTTIRPASTTRHVAALVQACDASHTMRDGRAVFGRRSCDERAASARDDACRGAAACGGAGRSMCGDLSAVFDLKFKMLDTIRQYILIRSEKPGSDTTVGDPDPPPGEEAEEQ